MNNSIPTPTYVTSLEEILWGICLVAITLVLHAFGMVMTLRVNGALQPKVVRAQSFVWDVGLLILSSWMIIVVHLFEVLVWALFIYWKQAIPNLNTSVAYYFSLNEYTTVGSNYNLVFKWRLLEGMLATAGLLAFAWSTGILLTLAQGFQDRQMQHLRDRRSKHHPPATSSASGR